MTQPLSREEQLEIVAENVSNGILVETKTRKIQYVNIHFLNIFNIKADIAALIGSDCAEVAALSAFIFTNPYEFLQKTEQCINDGKRITNEEWPLADGRFLLRDYQPLFKNGLQVGHLWCYKEITEIKRLEEENKKQKIFYEKILDNIPADIAIFDVNHRYLYINQHAVKDPDTRKWMIGKTDEEFFNGRSHLLNNFAKQRRLWFLKSLISGQTQEFIEHQKTSRGDLSHNLRRFFPLKNEKNDIEYVIGYGININSLVEKERELEYTNRKLYTLINGLEEALIIIGTDAVIEYVNPSWAKIFGYDRDETIGKGLCDFMSEEGLLAIQSAMEELSDETKQYAKRRISIINKFGTPKIINCFLNIFKDDAAVKFSCIFTDITAEERGVAELKLIVEKERTLNELKSNFVNMVSHELRTPLSIIQSSAEICEMVVQQGGEGINSLHEYLENITGEVDRITRLLSEVLLVSKIESGKINPVYHPLNIHGILLKIVEKEFSPWKDNRLLKIKFESDTEKLVASDEMMLHHIFSNILQNAFKYSPGKPSPVCRVKYCKAYWSFTVIDFGIGISQSDCELLSRPFFRGINVGEISGTGLGLTVVKYFLDQLKASMLVKSTLNKGTVVYLKFPEITHEEDIGD